MNEPVPVHLRKIHSTFERWLYLPSLDTLNVIAATYLANRLEGARLWLCMIGPASCGKTTLAETLLSLPNTHQLNSMTLGSFSSGYRDPRDPGRRFGLFEELSKGNHLLIIPDFSSILRKDPRIRGEIFAQLRSIYDGSWKQTFGTGVEVDWKGNIGIVACATPNFEREISSEAAFGERFLYWKMPPLDPMHLSERSLRNSEKTAEMRKALRTAMRSLHDIPLRTKLHLSLPVRNAIARETSFVALARTAVTRDPYTREILDIPQPESPARISQQLGQLLKGLLSLYQTKEPTEGMLELIELCAYSSIPDTRLRLMAMVGGRSYSLSDASHLTGLHRSVCYRTLEELTLLGLCHREGFSSKTACWRASEDYLPLFRRVRLVMKRGKLA